MECPAPEGAPTLASELRRGVNPYNLRYGALAAAVLGLGSALFLPDLGYGRLGQGAMVVVGLFVLLTLLHTLAHALMGWVFERGLALHCRGEYRAAARWLALAAQPGMDHYDPQGVALQALRECQNQSAT